MKRAASGDLLAQSNELMRQMRRKTARIVAAQRSASSLPPHQQQQQHSSSPAIGVPRSMQQELQALKQAQSPALLYQCPQSYLVDVLEGGDALDRYQAIDARAHRPLWLVQEEAVQFLKAREDDVDGLGLRGALYCDEMGLGKTRAILVLVLEQNQALSRLRGKRFATGPTLVVCAPILVANWVAELRRFPPGSFVYHVVTEAREAARCSAFLLEQCCDVVVTTYSALRAMRHAPERYSQLLYDIEWWRLVTDEAHVFVEETTETAQDVFALRARSCIAVTGTPVRNRRLDLKTMVRFAAGGSADKYSKELLDRIILMRTREQALERQAQVQAQQPLRPVHSLPDLKSVTRRVELVQFGSVQERVLYYMYAKVALQRKLSHRYNTPKLIGLMRQLSISAAVVKNLVLPRGLLAPDLYDADVLPGGDRQDDADCSVDDNPLVDFMRRQPAACRIRYRAGEAYRKLDALYHQHGDGDDDRSDCKACHADAVNFVWDPFALHSPEFRLGDGDGDDCKQYQHLYRELTRNLPRLAVTPAMLTGAPEGRPYDIDKTKAMLLHMTDRTLLLRSAPSSKERAIVDYVLGTPADDRVIIFSLYTGILDGLERALRQRGVGCTVVTGRNNAQTNAQRLQQFHRTQCKVLLMTLKLGNMGLNLTDCNHVLHADPWWNPWATEQGDYRIRRPGQLKDMFIVYFVMDNTMEVAIMNHTIRKKTLLKSMLRGVEDDDGADELTAEEQTLLFDYEVDITPL